MTGREGKLLLALIGLGVVYFVGVVRILDRWWFIDDPGQFAAVRMVDNPLRFFIDLEYAKHFGSGHGVVPMQMLDYWIDVHLPFPQPLTGYVHNLLTALAALVGVFFVLKRVTRDDTLAFGGAVAWVVLPSTVATTIFISTRHYVEGLVFSCVVFCLASSRRIGVAGWLGIVAVSVAGMLCKEIYAGLIPAILIAFGIVRRDRPMIAAAVALALAYAVYRILAVGGSMVYVMPLLGVGGYLKYLVTMPYTFAATLLGYPLVVMAIVGSVRYYREGGAKGRRDCWIFAGLLIATMFVLYPIAYAVVNSYRTPGPWYRSPFLPNTLVLVWLCLLAKRLVPSDRSLRFVAGLGVALVPGLVLCLSWWNANMRQEEAEARFCLRRPDRLLYTIDPTTWYLESVQLWYGTPEIHVIYAEKPNPAKDTEEFRRFGEVWSYRDGSVQRDPALTKALHARFRQ